MRRFRTLLGVAIMVIGVGLVGYAVTAAAAAPSSGHHHVCPAFVPHARTSGNVSLVRWSLNRHAGAAATIYATLRCAPHTAFSRRWERYLDGANLLKPMPAGLLLYTTNARTPEF